MQNFSFALLATASLFLVACAPQESASNSAQVAEPAAIAPTAPATVVEAAVASPDHSTLVAAVQAAGLADTLSGPGPFTVFAPTNAAFAKLPAGTVESLTQPANRATLTNILTYHVVAGRVSASDLSAQIAAGGGSATLTTVQGGTLTARRSGQSIQLTDASGATSIVTAADVTATNGVIHVIDTVLTLPAS